MENGFTAALRIALGAGADPDMRVSDASGLDFPLIWGACIANRPPVLELLAQAGVSLDSRSSFGAGLLHAAAEQEAVLSAKWLLDKALDVHQTDSEGLTPLHVAAAAGAVGMVELLLRAGADPNARAQYGRQPLDLLHYNNEEMDRGRFRRIEKALTDAGAKLSASYT